MSRLSPQELQELAADIEYTNKIEDRLRRSLSPLGTYNIPELLDKRRFEHLIPNGAFESYPVFDKCYIWQISMLNGRNTYKEGGKILKPDNELAREKNTAPRGVLVSAGLKAMDALYSTGIEIGHIVRFKKFSPFIMPVGEIEGKELAVMVIRDGDVEASEDLASSINSRTHRVSNVSKTGYDFRVEHLSADPSKGEWVCTGEKVSEYYDPSI
jgi:hypothetical protein